MRRAGKVDIFFFTPRNDRLVKVYNSTSEEKEKNKKKDGVNLNKINDRP